MNEIEELLQSADKFAEEAEARGKIVLVTKSNSLRRTAKEKKAQLKEVEEELDEQTEKLKKL